MTSNVYMMDFRAKFNHGLVDKLGILMEKAGLENVVGAKDLVAVKLHFGEQGNTAFIRPVFIRRIVEILKARGAIPFLTDANTLYAGTRSDAASHLTTAIRNGFAYAVADAPIVIADGLRGKTETAVTLNLKRFKQVFIGKEIVEADALVSAAHFKGHELSGFGGTIKNLGMGCASRKGKLAQHSTVGPQVKKKKCIGCGDCIPHCSQQALALVAKRAVIDPGKCIGCGECILICPQGAIQIQWDQAIPVFLENMVEYTAGVLHNKKGKCLFLNFITDVSPACDCYPFNDAPLVRNIGILASTDPVAIDQAAVDLVNQEAALPGCCLQSHTQAGQDKFKGLYPQVDWTIQLAYAEKLGLGLRNYQLVAI
jgi:hypothetical protein